MATYVPANQPPQYEGFQIEQGADVPLYQPSANVLSWRETRPSYIFLVFSAVVLCLSAITLSVNYWVYFCDSWVSLTDVVSGGYSDSISKAEKFACDTSNHYLWCEHMCHNYQSLRAAGKAMLGLGIVSMICTGFAVLRVSMILVRYRMIAKGWIAKVAVIAGALFWILGTIVYGAAYGNVHHRSKDSIIGPGIMAAIGVAVLQLILCSIGLIAVNKLT